MDLAMLHYLTSCNVALSDILQYIIYEKKGGKIKMDKKHLNQENKKPIIIKKEITYRKNGNSIITLDYKLFKILKCYNKKKIFICLSVDKNLTKYIYLTSKKPKNNKYLIYYKEIKLIYRNTRVKSPYFNIPATLKYFPFITEKRRIIFKEFDKPICDIDINNSVLLLFEY